MSSVTQQQADQEFLRLQLALSSDLELYPSDLFHAIGDALVVGDSHLAIRISTAARDTLLEIEEEKDWNFICLNTFRKVYYTPAALQDSPPHSLLHSLADEGKLKALTDYLIAAFHGREVDSPVDMTKLH